jgi:hypothetical protein
MSRDMKSAVRALYDNARKGKGERSKRATRPEAPIDHHQLWQKTDEIMQRTTIPRVETVYYVEEDCDEGIQKHPDVNQQIADEAPYTE